MYGHSQNYRMAESEYAVNLAEYVMKYLAEKGVRHVFYLPGGGAMYLVDALGLNKDLTAIRCLHEQVAGVAADVYAQVAGLGVCLVTSGPGATNAVTACAGAWADSCPTIFISGTVRRDQLIGATGLRMHGIQETDIIPVVEPITKLAVRVMEPSQIRMILDRAVFSATTGRKGPIWLDIPQDVQAAEVDENLPGGRYYEPHLPVTHVPDVMTDLLQARRPVIVVGAGILPHDAEFRELARKLNVPVLTTFRMYGLFSQDDPLWFGRPGNPGHRYASKILQNADLILSIGARMAWNLTGYNLKDFAPYAKWYMVDIDYAELKKHERAIPIYADAGDFIGRMLEVAQEIDCDDWLDHCNAWKHFYTFTPLKNDPRIFSHQLALSSKPDDIIVPCSSGLDIEGFYQGWVPREGQYLHFIPDFGSIGFGLATAIGACLASGGKHTICVEGDGGYLLNQSAWETVKEYHLPIDYYIMTNGIYGSIQATEDNYFNGRRMGSTLPNIVTNDPMMHVVPIDPAFRPDRPPARIINGLPQAATIEETFEWPEPQPAQN
jgi:acetolactate synthase-1/2/3 large subunit